MKLPQIVDFKGQRVLTTQQLAQCYETTRHIISNNFTRNKDRYTVGKHYIPLEGTVLQDFKRCHQFDDSMKKVSILYLWTEKGALLHAKSLNTDKAWEVYDYLVDFYFRAKEERKVPVTIEPKAVVPVQTSVEQVKEKHSIPQMDDPLAILQILLKVAEQRGLIVKSCSFKALDSALRNNKIGIRTGILLEKVVYELAWELAHSFIHYDCGDMVKSPLSKDYNNQATRAADMIIIMLNQKIATN